MLNDSEAKKYAERLAREAQRQERLKPAPVLYLDLDGTVRKGYDELGRFVNEASDVEVFPEAVREMRRYKRAGYRIAAVTNQGGVALGHLSLQSMNEALLETQRQCDDLFDIMVACRHHPEATDPLMAHCWCRKPRYGMLIQGADGLGQRFRNELYPPHLMLMVGDRPEDQKCAEGAGIRFVDAAEWRKGLVIEVGSQPSSTAPVQ